MARDNYDDWNIATKEKQVEHFNLKGVSFIFFVCVLTLTITSIVNVFSVTFVSAIEAGLSSYSYLLYFLSYIAIGIVAGLLAYILPRALLNTFAFIMSIGGIVLLFFNVVGKTSFTFTETIYCLIIVFDIIYLGSYFAKRMNKVEKLSQLITPIAIGTATFTGILFNGNITFAGFYLIIILVIFRKCGVNAKGMLLLLVYLAVPFCFWSLSSQGNLNELFRFASLKSVSSSSQHAMRMKCLLNSGFLGKGIGLGEYKSLTLEGIAGPYVICNIANETGYLGLGLVFLVFTVMIYCLYRYSAYSLSTDTYASNITGIYAGYLVLQIVFNILQTMDIVPFTGISLPFYSFGINIALVLLMSIVSYKFMHRKPVIKADKTKDSYTDIEFDESNEKKKN